MKEQLKELAFRLLGRRRVLALLDGRRKRSATFSEIDLLEEHFCSSPAPGVMIDVGAHHGESLMASQCAGWRVIAFEPDPVNRRVLEKRTDPAFVEILPLAVSDHEAPEIIFYASPESDGVSSLSAFLPSHREVTRVPLTTLRVVLSARPNVTRVDFLKIDTEGHDFFVLKGFPWERFQPEVVTCEFEDGKTKALGYDYREMGDYLVQRGYHVFVSEWAPIARYGATHLWIGWSEYPCAISDPAGWGNFVAFRPDTDLSAVSRYVARFQHVTAAKS
jgi:FkbM family methyltransferase